MRFKARTSGRHSGSAIAPREGQSGVALAILVWFLAALSLLAAGLVLQARVDVKLAQLHSTRARVEALADGAIQLALARMSILEQEGEVDRRSAQTSGHTLGKFYVVVNITPVAGLIDLNLAPEMLLLNLFLSAPNMDENVAQELALNVIEWRSSSLLQNDELYGEAAANDANAGTDSRLRHGRFEAIEDLLLVPGVDRAMYEALRESVYVSQKGELGVDWMAAPTSVLQALGMSTDGAREWVVNRGEADAALLGIPEDIDPALLGEGGSPVYRIDALVAIDETTFKRRRWVNKSRTGADGLPWHFFRTEAIAAVTGEELEILAVLEESSFGE